MKLNEVVKPFHFEFTVGELSFRASSFQDEHTVFDVIDAGGLKVGEFDAWLEDDGDIGYRDKGQYNDTLERLRKTGDSSKIAANVRKTLTSAA